MVDTSKMTGAQRTRYWKRHVRDWRESGLKQNAYCNAHDLNVGVFRYWVKKFPAKDGAKEKREAGRLRVVPIVPATAQPAVMASQEIEVRFSDCVLVLKGAVDEVSLTAVMRSLRSSRCGV